MKADAELRERAARVIPGGLWGHLRVQGLSPGYPQFFQRAEVGIDNQVLPWPYL